VRRPIVKKLIATLATLLLGLLGVLLASDVGARLSVIPGRPGGPRPTQPQATPSTPPGNSGVGLCQSTIAQESTRLLADLRSALGDCLGRGARCLVDEAGSVACCEEAALVCQGDLVRIASATRRFREAVRGGSCASVSLAQLLSPQGLGFDAAACGRHSPPVAVADHASFADCLQLLLTRDVLHQVGLTDVPRAPEALVCMGLEEVLADAIGSDPATCEPSPSPVPTATPVPTAAPTPGPTSSSGQATPTPTAAGPTPTPTPSPGVGGCQPRLFGPCQDGTFTGCCQASRHCAFIIGDDGPGYCIADPPSATETPGPTATPVPTVTQTPSGATPTPTPILTITPSPTQTPAPSGSVGPTPPPTCSTLTVTVSVAYDQGEFPDVAGMTVSVDYPASVSIPGIGNQASVAQRVTNLTGVTGGLFSVGDNDSDGDNVDDELAIGLVSLGTSIPSGAFARVSFDCASGATIPDATDFGCTPDVASDAGSSVDATCSVTVATP